MLIGCFNGYTRARSHAIVTQKIVGEPSLIVPLKEKKVEALEDLLVFLDFVLQLFVGYEHTFFGIGCQNKTGDYFLWIFSCGRCEEDYACNICPS
jgi:hypothetical protein